MKAPILRRTLLYERLRDGSFRLLDFAIVNTSLGAMIEPRTLFRPGGGMVNEDVYDSSFTDLLEATPGVLASVGFGGEQWPKQFNNTQP